MNNTKILISITLLCFCCNLTGNTGNEKAQAADKPAKEIPLMTPELEFQGLQRKIILGKATLAEVRKALTNTDVGALTNTMHALYSMRWHRGVLNLLDDLWANYESKYPDLAWKQLGKVPVRIALASTINRIRIFGAKEYKEYIRAHKDDEHEFHRAQVVIALGLNADPEDIPYIYSMADANNVYVAQTAVTALGMMTIPQAEDALIKLKEKYENTEKGKLVQEVLSRAYK